MFEYYGIDIYDFIRGRVACRRMVSLIEQLPSDCRLSRRIRNDPLTASEHLEMSMLDTLGLVAYFGKFAALGGIDKKAHKEILKNAPTPSDRPQYVKEQKVKKEKVFMSGRDFQAMVSGRVRTGTQKIVDHSTPCITSGQSKNGFNCGSGCEVVDFDEYQRRRGKNID